MKTIRLKEGKERSLLRRHPWIFDSAIARGGADAGRDGAGRVARRRVPGLGGVQPGSRIRARVWSFDEAQRIDAAFLGSVLRTRNPGALPFRHSQRRHAAGARRVRRPAGPDRRSLRRHAGGAVPGRRRRALEAGARRRACCGRPASRGCTSAPTPAPARWKVCRPAPDGCSGEGADRAHHPRARLALHAGHRQRPQDRLLPGPARQPRQVRRVRAAAAVPARAQLLLLHRRLHAWRPWPAALLT